MKKGLIRGICGGLIVLTVMLFVGPTALAMDKEVAENPLLRSQSYARPAIAEAINCEVGAFRNRISNSTVLPGGDNEWTLVFGDDTLVDPSGVWTYPSVYANNSYLYFASLRIGKGEQLVHFSTDTSPGMEIKSINTDPTAISHLDTYFEISDQSPLVLPQDQLGVLLHAYTYAWSETYRDDFIIYDFWIKNLNELALDSVYVAVHNDADISLSEGGSGAQAYSRDDMPDYVRNDETNEYISYMRDADNPVVAGNDLGGNKLPKEATGFIGID